MNNLEELPPEDIKRLLTAADMHAVKGSITAGMVKQLIAQLEAAQKEIKRLNAQLDVREQRVEKVKAELSVAHEKLLKSVVLPKGWRLVPIKPTPRMMGAGTLISAFHDDIEDTYRAMIVAAPSIADFAVEENADTE